MEKHKKWSNNRLEIFDLNFEKLIPIEIKEKKEIKLNKIHAHSALETRDLFTQWY